MSATVPTQPVELNWQDPPPPGHPGRAGSGKWAAIADALRSNPGRWALVAEDGHSTIATHINRGRLSAFKPAGSFEAVSRRNDQDSRYVYARFLGEPTSDGAA